MVVGKNRRFPPASAGCSQVASSSSGGGLNPIQQLYPNEKSKQTNPRQVQIFIALSHIRPVFLHLVRYFQIITLVFVLEKQYVHLYGDYQFAPVQQVHTQRASFYVPRVYKEYRGILASQPGEQLRWMIQALFASLFPAYFGLFWLISSHMLLLNQPKSAGFSTSRNTESKRLFVSFLVYRNSNFDEKKPSNSLLNWISKYRHPLFRISR